MSHPKRALRRSFLEVWALPLVWSSAAFAEEATTLWQFDTEG